MSKPISIRELKKDIPKEAKNLCETMLTDLEKATRPVLEAVKCSLEAVTPISSGALAAGCSLSVQR